MLWIELTPTFFFSLSLSLIHFDQNKVSVSSHASERVGGIFRPPDAAWAELIPSQRGKLRTGAVAASAFHSAMKTVPTARLFRSLPPNQPRANDTWPWDGGPSGLGVGWRERSGQQLATVILRPRHPPLCCPSLLPLAHPRTHTQRPLGAKWTRGCSPVWLLLLEQCSG